VIFVFWGWDWVGCFDFKTHIMALAAFVVSKRVVWCCISIGVLGNFEDN
jgi:hypothetical protein